LNELDWHARHRDHDTKWYIVYYQAWRLQHPDYQRQYRLVMTAALTVRIRQRKQRLGRLLKDFQAFQALRRKQMADEEQRLLAAIRARRQGPLALSSG